MTNGSSFDSSLAPSPHASAPLGGREVAIRLLVLVLLLFGFLVAIETMSKAIKSLTDVGFLGGGGDEQQLFGGVQNPFAGLALGVLFTVLVQSSSTTTSTIVAVVGSGTLSVGAAVPMVMGANIGTTITNTLVSIGHVRQAQDFKRAFAAATVHDFFNILAVAVMLPLELATRFLSRSATWLSVHLQGTGGTQYESPIKAAIKSVHKAVETGVEALGAEGRALGVVMLVLGIALTFACLFLITKNMRKVIAGPTEVWMNRALESSGFVPLLIGIVITVAVQSSSITTSLLVPMCAAGVMSLDRAFPIMLGANIGTTVTALLASLAQSRPEALSIALVHVLFNTFGVTTMMVVPGIARIPLGLARGLAELTMRSRLWIVAYVLGVFVLIPLAGWILWG